jgi:hypothetical protein
MGAVLGDVWSGKWARRATEKAGQFLEPIARNRTWLRCGITSNGLVGMVDFRSPP